MNLALLFGLKKKKKHCDRRKKSCRRSTKKYNVTGSVCNKLKRKTCKSTRGCNYVKKRGCRRAKGFAKIVASGAVPIVSKRIAMAAAAASGAAADVGAPIIDRAMAAAAAAADVAVTEVESVGGSSKDAREAAFAAAIPAAKHVVEEAGGSSKESMDHLRPELIKMVFSEAMAAPPAPPISIGNLAAEAAAGRSKLKKTAPRNSPVHSSVNPIAAAAAAKAKKMGVAMEFGRSRTRFGFGSVCSTLLPKDINSCMNYQVDGMYPCNWSGGANSRCQQRPGGPVPYSMASTVGKNMAYVMSITPSLIGMSPPPVEEPVAPTIPLAVQKSLTETCKMYGQADCNNRLNCKWMGGAINRCQARRGTAKEGLRWRGPELPLGASFGKKRKMKRKVHKKKRTTKKQQ